MKKTKIKTLILSTSALLIFSSANAVDYTVQVGAYQALTHEAIRNAESHGEVFQSIGNDNLTRLHIGRFVSQAEAEQKRNELRSAGFSDAFVTQISVTSNPSTPSSTPSLSYQKPATSTQQYQQPAQNTYSSSSSNSSSGYGSTSPQPNLSGLTADEKSKAAFLDGRLRIYSDGQFYTLEQYRETKKY